MILSGARLPTGSRRPGDVPINDLKIFAPSLKSKNRYLTERPLFPKYYFMDKSLFFSLVPGRYPEDLM